MIITWQGHEFFKVQFGDTTLAFNPVSKDSKLKASKFGADIALVSLNHEDFNGGAEMGHGDRQPFVIDGPGEYEIKGVFIKGFKSQSKYGGKERINTVYQIALEGMNLCFLGALSKDIDAETQEALDDIDILFVPIGGEGVLNPEEAYKLAVKLEPRLIIPMHYEGDADLKKFLKEGGEEKKTPEEKLTIKKKDLEGKEGDIVVLLPQNK